LYLRRPQGYEDFLHMEAYQRQWAFGTRSYRPMLIENLEETPLGATPSTAPFHKPAIGTARRLNPQSKAWSFFLLQDAAAQTQGIYIGAGMSETMAERHLRDDLDELPLDDFSWRQYSVPDPARPELTRNACVVLLTDWNDLERTAPLIDAANKTGDLLTIERLFTQVLHSGPEDHSWTAQEFGFRFIRTCRAKTEEKTPVSVWVWERQKQRAAIFRQSRSELEATPPQVKAIAQFYQSLSGVEREELVHLAEGFSITARMRETDLNLRTIEVRRSRIREALGLGQGGLTQRNIDRLRELGIRAELGSSNDIGSLVCQPVVAQAIKRIAWFYGELPSNFG
jgi:hypothetical protein